MYTGHGFNEWGIGDVGVIKVGDTYHLFHLYAQRQPITAPRKAPLDRSVRKTPERPQEICVKDRKWSGIGASYLYDTSLVRERRTRKGQLGNVGLDRS